MGAFVGRTAQQGGRGVMVNYRYENGAKHLPSEADGVKLRPKQ
jgi:branched-chain amino acid transport system substrate-binding protein